jgi:hypothetical protein
MHCVLLSVLHWVKLTLPSSTVSTAVLAVALLPAFCMQLFLATDSCVLLVLFLLPQH